jgi:hypothetical protein
VTYPVVILPLLAAFGEVRDTSVALRFIPKYVGDDELNKYAKACGISVEQNGWRDILDKVHDWILDLENFGLEVGRAMPKDHFGNYGFILTVEGERLLGPSSSGDKVARVVRAVLRNLRYASTVRMSYSYGTMGEFAGVARALARRGFRGDVT